MRKLIVGLLAALLAGALVLAVLTWTGQIIWVNPRHASSRRFEAMQPNAASHAEASDVSALDSSLRALIPPSASQVKVEKAEFQDHSSGYVISMSGKSILSLMLPSQEALLRQFPDSQAPTGLGLKATLHMRFVVDGFKLLFVGKQTAPDLAEATLTATRR